jgi:hypothetical protein
MKFTSIVFAALVAATQFSSTFAKAPYNVANTNAVNTAYGTEVVIDVSSTDTVSDSVNNAKSIKDALEAGETTFYMIASFTQPSDGTVVVVTGDADTPDQLKYTPPSDFSGDVTFKYSFNVGAKDASGKTQHGDTAKDSPERDVTVTVNAAIPTSIAADDSIATAYETAVTIDVSGTDTVTDGVSSSKSIEDALKAGDMSLYAIDSTTGLTQPSDGTVVVVTGDADTPDQLKYTPDSGFTGTDTFTYKFTVGAKTSGSKHGSTTASAAATVTVTVKSSGKPTVVKQTVEIPDRVSSGNAVTYNFEGLVNIAAVTPAAPDMDSFNAIVGPVVGDSDNFAANTSTEAVKQNLSTILLNFFNFFRGGN